MKKGVTGDMAQFLGGVMNTPRRLLAFIATTAIFCIAPATAYADPAPDPHIPDMQAGYCPGGGMGSEAEFAYCDGVPYPDGSYWHAIRYELPAIGHPYDLVSPGMQCVVDPGVGLPPQPAPPGGCGGAV
jgi:hypothetical protein